MLDNLPKTLKTTFEDIYRRIQSEEGRTPELAKKALMWVMCTARPLSPVELSAMISQSSGIELGMDIFLEMCHNLLKVELDIVQFFHLSVTEFFATETYFTILEANTMVVDFCLSCLNHRPALELESGLQEYIVVYWPIHVQRCDGQNTNHTIWDVLKAFLGSFNKPSAMYIDWLRDVALCETEVRDLWGLDYEARSLIRAFNLPLIVAAHFGFVDGIKSLWDEDTWDIDHVTWSGTPLLAIACAHEKFVQMLLDKGANFNAQGGYYGNALQTAVSKGSEKVVQMLLDKGADVNVQNGCTALHRAVSKGSENVVQMLLDRGADVNVHNGMSGSTALHTAASNGSEKVVHMLLDKGADFNAREGLSRESVLEIAAYRGYQKVVQILFDIGVDVNAQGGYFGNALQAAGYGGHEKVVHMLLDNGANVNAQGGYYGNALQAAGYRGHEKVVQMLLDIGANVNAQGGDYGNPLQAAARGGYKKVVQMLLDKGADINAQGGYYGNALQAAASEGSEKVVKMLLDKGADVNARGGTHGNALRAAAYNDSEKVVQMLLDYGAVPGSEGNKQ